MARSLVLRAPIFAAIVLAACSSQQTPASEASPDAPTISSASTSVPAFDAKDYEWPESFSVPFTNQQGVGGIVSGGHLDYDFSDPDSGKFHSTFEVCPSFPGLVRELIGQPCEFYLVRAADTGTYEATAYVEPMKVWQSLGHNLGPPRTDLVGRYATLLPFADYPCDTTCPTTPACPPTGPLTGPLCDSPVPDPSAISGNTAWLLTAGSQAKPPDAASSGYYIASLDSGPPYPPLAIIGNVSLRQAHPLDGQLMWTWSEVELDPDFASGTFTPPDVTDWSELQGEPPPLTLGTGDPPMNCGTCHIFDPP